jgi:hypothetical protein
MVNKTRIIILLTLAFLRAHCQQNNLVIENPRSSRFEDPSVININEHQWAMLSYRPMPLDSLSLELILVDYDEAGNLSHKEFPMLGDGFFVKSATLIESWTSNDNIFGISSLFFPQDNTFQLALFRLKNEQFEWTLIDSTQNQNFMSATRTAISDDTLFLVSYDRQEDSSGIHYPRQLFSIKKNGELFSAFTSHSKSLFTAFARRKDGDFLIANPLNTISRLSANNQIIDTFHTHEKIGIDTTIEMLLPIEKLICHKEYIYVGASAGITRFHSMANPRGDGDGIVLKLSETGDVLAYHTITDRDSTIQPPLYDYTGDEARASSIDFFEDEDLIQATTTNSGLSIWSSNTPNAILFTRLNEDLELIWQKRYVPEDSARVLCLEVKTQPEGGFVAINRIRNWKYKPENGYDLQFLRFNHRGELMGETILPNQSSYLGIYPNPSNGIFTLESSQSIQQIEVFDLQGRKVFEAKNQTQINLSALPNNTYLARILLDNGLVETKKLVLMK